MNSAESRVPASICMACSSVEGSSTLSEVRVVGLYQYIFLSSFPKKDDALNVPGATSTETGVSCELRADGVLRSWAAEACRQAHGGRVLESAPNHGYHLRNFRKNSNRSEMQSEVRVRQAARCARSKRRCAHHTG